MKCPYCGENRGPFKQCRCQREITELTTVREDEPKPKPRKKKKPPKPPKRKDVIERKKRERQEKFEAERQRIADRRLSEQEILKPIPKIDIKDTDGETRNSEVSRLVSQVSDNQTLSLSSDQEYRSKDSGNWIINHSNIMGQDYVKVIGRSDIGMFDIVDDGTKTDKQKKPVEPDTTPPVIPPEVPPEEPEEPEGCSCSGVSISYTSLQMDLLEEQTLSVSGTVAEGCSITWAIESGGGSLSATSGTSTDYTAPASNEYCVNNPTISLSVDGTECDSITISVTNPIASGYVVATRFYCDSDYSPALFGIMWNYYQYDCQGNLTGSSSGGPTYECTKPGWSPPANPADDCAGCLSNCGEYCVDTTVTEFWDTECCPYIPV